jgi:hypothetical protein
LNIPNVRGAVFAEARQTCVDACGTHANDAQAPCLAQCAFQAAKREVGKLVSWGLVGLVIVGGLAVVVLLLALVWYCIKQIARW